MGESFFDYEQYINATLQITYNIDQSTDRHRHVHISNKRHKAEHKIHDMS